MRFRGAVCVLVALLQLGSAKWLSWKVKACVQVENKTPGPLVDLWVQHKYSDLYKNRNKWARLEPGATTAPHDFSVAYKIGFLSVGMDWWRIQWRSPNNSTLYYSDPSNFRSVLDFVESHANMALVGDAVSDFFFNKESMEGFKDYLLRRSDSNDRCTRIVVGGGDAVYFFSPSGASSTVVSSEDLRPGCQAASEMDWRKG